MPGSSLEVVAPDGESRRFEPQVGNAGASADSGVLHHVADGIRAQRAGALGGGVSHSIAVESIVARANIGSSAPPAAVRMLAFSARARVARFAKPPRRRHARRRRERAGRERPQTATNRALPLLRIPASLGRGSRGREDAVPAHGQARREGLRESASTAGGGPQQGARRQRVRARGPLQRWFAAALVRRRLPLQRPSRPRRRRGGRLVAAATRCQVLAALLRRRGRGRRYLCALSRPWPPRRGRLSSGLRLALGPRPPPSDMRLLLATVGRGATSARSSMSAE